MGVQPRRNESFVNLRNACQEGNWPPAWGTTFLGDKNTNGSFPYLGEAALVPAEVETGVAEV